MATVTSTTDSPQEDRPTQAEILRQLLGRVAPVIEEFDSYPPAVRKVILRAAADFASDLAAAGVLR